MVDEMIFYFLPSHLPSHHLILSFSFSGHLIHSFLCWSCVGGLHVSDRWVVMVDCETKEIIYHLMICLTIYHVISLEIDKTTILYTGDYSMEEDRHLMAAEVRDEMVDEMVNDEVRW